MQNKIAFGDQRFDAVVAAGVFEYMGGYYQSKLAEIRAVLKENGTLVATYTNFGHIRANPNYYPYNNVLPLRDFIAGLETCFQVQQWFPSSHNRVVGEPRRGWLKALNMQINFNIPLVSRLLAVNYFFICSPLSGVP
jgi:hypothetical protein